MLILILFSIFFASAGAEPQNEPEPMPSLDPTKLLAILCNETYSDFSIELPFFPQLVASGITIAANNIKIENLNKCKWAFTKDFFGIKYTNPHIRITVDPMILAGKLWNLPTAGRGKMQIDVWDLQIIGKALSIIKPIKIILPWDYKVNPITIRRIKVHHDNLNPGQESGQLINDVLSNMQDEFANFLADKINELLEKLMSPIITNSFGPPTEEEFERGISFDSLPILHLNDLPDNWQSAYKMLMKPRETTNEDLENVLSLKRDLEQEIELFIKNY